MRKTILITGFIVILSILLWPQTVHENEIGTEIAEADQGVLVSDEKPEEEKPEEERPVAYQTADREAWLKTLEQCESGGDPNALNPVDLDGTPSHGLLQFKDTTFIHFSQKYNIEGELYDPEAQRAIVRRMMDDESVVWEKQFPNCVRKHGRPPQKVVE